MSINFDFSGVATKYGVKCSDGVTIRKGAFKKCHGKRVPLVWSHRHDGPKAVLGSAILEHKDDEVRTYCSFNDSEEGKDARIRVEHGDIDALSIYANHLKREGSDVVYGDIKEVSLCISGANPEAHIDNVILSHGEESETEAVIYTDEYIDNRAGELFNSDDDDEEDEDTEEENDEDDIAQADDSKNEEDESVGEILDGMTDKQRAVALLMYELGKKDAAKSKETKVVKVTKESDNKSNEIKQSDEGGKEMNVFDKKGKKASDELAHADMLREDEAKIFKYAKDHHTTFKDAVNHYAELRHDDEPAGDDSDDPTPTPYGITDIEHLFPDFKSVNNTPAWVKRDTTWVDKFMGAARKVPFSRIKSLAADITPDTARAKGYTKGNRKIEEVFALLKRTTEPTTVYKKQKVDRQDIIDITDFGFVGWLNEEMTLMLHEEVARAALVSDGRGASDDDKIDETHIRPIYTDDAFYAPKIAVEHAPTATEQAKAEALIDAAIRARKQYKGTGKPTMFTTEDNLTEMLLIKDGVGHRLYKDEAELATALRVKEIVSVPVMDNKTRTSSGVTLTLAAIIVNPVDYAFGSTKGGEITSFEQFDIDFNQYKYLKEGRCSGALTIPYSALVLEYKPVAG